MSKLTEKRRKRNKKILLSCNVLACFKQNIVIVLLVIIMLIIPKISTTDDIDGRSVVDHPKSNFIRDRNQATVIGTNAKQVPFVEYFIEHNVSQKDARNSFFDVGIKLLTDKPLPSWCRQAVMACTSKIMDYCLNGRMLDDHCCCDSRHEQEPLPWIPHSCYIGDSCRPSIGSCIAHTEYRECCCNRALAKRWKNIYSISAKTTINRLSHLAWIIVLLLSWSNNI